MTSSTDENFISSWVNRYVNPFLERHFELRLDLTRSSVPNNTRRLIFPSKLTDKEVEKLFPSKKYVPKGKKRRFSVCSLEKEDKEVNCCIECCICLGSIVEGCKIRTLRCNHFYHSECISSWLQVNATCPLCRKKSFNDKQGAITSLRRSFTV